MEELPLCHTMEGASFNFSSTSVAVTSELQVGIMHPASVLTAVHLELEMSIFMDSPKLTLVLPDGTDLKLMEGFPWNTTCAVRHLSPVRTLPHLL